VQSIATSLCLKGVKLERAKPAVTPYLPLISHRSISHTRGSHEETFPKGNRRNLAFTDMLGAQSILDINNSIGPAAEDAHWQR